jgi:putative ABC transport system substrate-binding protein
MLRRSAVIWTLASLGAAAIPDLAFTQAGDRLPRIGVLSGRETPIDDGWRAGMRELGYREGQNVEFVTRRAGGAIERLPSFAAELVALKVDVIFAASGPATGAARQATSTIPIVFTMLGDPVAARWVKSYARPGGNMSGLAGLSPDLAEKRLELLKRVAPGAKRVAVLVNPSNPLPERGVRELIAAAKPLAVQIQVFEARNAEAVAPALSAIGASRSQALMVLQDVMLAAEPQRSRILQHTAAARLPALYVENDWVTSGGLMSYAPSLYAMGRRAAAYVDMVLKGAKPADLPVELPTKFELTVNLKTANALGLTIPQSILVIADKVIE